MTDICTDPASEVIDVFTAAIREAFAPDSECPPLGGGATEVRFFAGDGAPLAAWDAHAAGTGCDTPFLWVRAMRRYYTETFPTPTIATWPCNLPEVVAIEVGVGRCAVVDAEPSWDDYAREAEVSLDDSWRIKLTMDRAACKLRDRNHFVGTDTIAPYGPEGGVIAWTGVAYVRI